jgi:hypothetical protein
MPKYVEFPLEDGGVILIESADDKKSGTGFVRGGANEEAAADKAAHSFDQAVENIRKSSNVLVSKLRGLSQAPDEMEINFSLKASGEAGSLFVAKGGTEASYNVSLRWRREDEKKEDKKDEEKKD